MDGYRNTAAPDRTDHPAAEPPGLAGDRRPWPPTPVMGAPRLTKRTRAAAIMLALGALFLLSAMVISWALDINTRLTISGSANRLLEAEAMACSGAEVALHPSVKPGSPVLHGSFPSNQSYEARITGEGGRLNVNRLAAAMIANDAAA